MAALATTIAVAVTLATAPLPTDQEPATSFTVASAQVNVGERGSEIIALDHDGSVVGVLTISSDTNDHVRVDADFDDGYATFVLVDDELVVIESTFDPDVLARRAQAIADLVPNSDGTRGKARDCGVAVAMAIVLCAPALAGRWWGFLSCPIGVLSAWCQCAPLADIEVGDEC